ncbi:MAG: UvrD-helicase domain-containing protein, partial [Phycisphaerae bacterium]|nr:UvrD-helicase domain-containing protein [Phycisphaerae bacterium]
MHDLTTRHWTQAQQTVIESTGEALLVSAAAGSGKTSVLAERCARLIDHEDPLVRCDADELLVVTFTRSAAAEMRSRIAQSLRRRACGRDDVRLSRQLRLLDRAQIGTLHSFCGAIIRRHFHLLGIDPGFTMLNEKEARLLRIEVARELFERRYRLDAGGEFQRLIDGHFSGYDLQLLRALLRAHDVRCSLVDPDAWARQTLARIESAAQAGPRDCEAGRELLTLLHDHVVSVAGQIQLMNPTLARLSPPHAEYLQKVAAELPRWIEHLAAGDYDGAAMMIRNYQFPRAPRGTGGAHDSEIAKLIFHELRDALREGWFARAVRFSWAEWQSGMSAAAEPARQFLRLAEEFDAAYSQAKRELRAVDFADLERMALRVLSDPAASEGYRRQFRYVLVDEFQDINQLQQAILSRVSRAIVASDPSSANFFAVGDVKQSIYRFRLADPMQFLTHAREYASGKPRRRVVVLSENFRSDPGLIEAINALFRRLMTERASEIEYDQSHELRPGRPPSQYSPLPNPVELHLLPEPPPALADGVASLSDLDSTEREAVIAADIIQRFTAPAASPRFRQGDIAILLRTMKVKAEKFAAILRRFGIRVHADSSSGFFDATEIRDMLSLLQCLDNPRQDIPLAALLRSPLVALASPEDALARIRLKYPGMPFHRAV